MATTVLPESQPAPSVDGILETARSFLPEIRERAAETESGRRVPPDLIERMARAGLFRIMLPRAYGGLELNLADAARIIEEVSAADGSTGWCLMIGAGTNAFCAHMPEAGAREMFWADPDLVTAGMFSPSGRADVVDGGYRATGRWSFGSGCQHSGWLLGNCVVHENDEPRSGPSGPETVMLFFPAAQVEVHDTWRVSGLRGTGSHDFSVTDVFVPLERSLVPFADRPVQPGPLYAIPFQAFLWLGMAPVPLGIARGAIDELKRLSVTKAPKGFSAAGGVLRDRVHAQMEVARAEGVLRAARAFVRETTAELWDHAVRRERPGADTLALAGIAANHAARAAAHVTDVMYDLGGASSIRDDSPLQRAWRDAHAATQHVALGSGVLEFAGRTLLGTEAKR